jgi:hypothetical protein
VIRLSSPELELAVDPDRGGDILSLRLLSSGLELLFQAPWEARPARERTPDPAAWTQGWRGGWQLLFPNAGWPCTVEGRAHGFHGAASLARWQVTTATERAVELAWRDDCLLSVNRHVEVAGQVVHVRTRIRNEGTRSAPFVLVEHLIFGPPLVGEQTTIDAPSCLLLPLADDGPALVAAETALAWPLCDDGRSREDWSSIGSGPHGRFGALLGLEEKRVKVAKAALGITATLEWSDSLPYLWLWQEVRALEDAPFDGRTVCLGMEPASVPTAEGLAASLERNEATVLGPDEQFEAAVQLEILEHTRRWGAESGWNS